MFSPETGEDRLQSPGRLELQVLEGNYHPKGKLPPCLLPHPVALNALFMTITLGAFVVVLFLKKMCVQHQVVCSFIIKLHICLIHSCENNTCIGGDRVGYYIVCSLGIHT